MGSEQLADAARLRDALGPGTLPLLAALFQAPWRVSTGHLDDVETTFMSRYYLLTSEYVPLVCMMIHGAYLMLLGILYRIHWFQHVTSEWPNPEFWSIGIP